MVSGILTIPLIAQNSAAPSAAAHVLGEFVAGPENVLVARALRDCLDRTFAAHSPLVLYGPHGSGKTHLARGLAAWWRRHFPSRGVVCLTASEFAQDYATAQSDDRLASWRRQICEPDLLVVDDLGQLGGRHGAQQELRRALDELDQRGALVVVTARTLPAHLRLLLPSLRSRLSAGLALPLALPDRTTRRFIVDRVASARGIALSERAVQGLANGLCVSVPALVGAVLELEIAARSAGASIDAERVRRFISDRPAGASVKIHHIARLTARYFGFKVADLKSPHRRRPLVAGRSVAMYLARQLTHKSLEQIGVYFGGRDHTTVLHSCRRTEGLLRRDRATRKAIAELKKALMTS